MSRQRPSDKEKLALKYFLRLLVQDASGSDYWNTVVSKCVWLYLAACRPGTTKWCSRSTVTGHSAKPSNEQTAAVHRICISHFVNVLVVTRWITG